MKKTDLSTHWPVRKFLDKLSSTEPAPGGGSAAALSGALGTALGAMVASILLSRPKLRVSEKKKLKALAGKLQSAQRDLQRLIREDALAYLALINVNRNKKSSRAALLRVHLRAIECPIAICAACAKAIQSMAVLERSTGPYLGSDVKAGRALLAGAFRASLWMVEVNFRGSDFGSATRRLRAQVQQLKNAVN